MPRIDDMWICKVQARKVEMVSASVEDILTPQMPSLPHSDDTQERMMCASLYEHLRDFDEPNSPAYDIIW